MSKTIIITGSTDGIGKLTAHKLAAAGHEIILHGRNPEKLASVIQEIETETGSDKVCGYVADLADLSAVKHLGEQLATNHPRIDVLINNAGVYTLGSSAGNAGTDLRFLVNYLAPVVLTKALLPVLKNSTAPRVINLSSAAQAAVSLTALRGEQSLGDQSAYAQSKLALTMWNNAMAQQHPDVTFIAVNPGSLLNTKMVREAFGRHYAPADKGAQILVSLATDSKHNSQSGKYFDNDRGSYGSAHSDATDAGKTAQLMQVTEEILGEI
ncbi:short-chain dehydrogenase [Lewinellaceae bacterium SD302]|nr:short-chain dehydrogenase [Lewinellaceae bacterium SD302]